MQGGSVVKVEEEEETALRERWVVTYDRASVCVCARAPSGVGEERCNREIEGERERKRDLDVATCSLNFRGSQI